MNNLKSEIDHWNKVIDMVENKSIKKTQLVNVHLLKHNDIYGVDCEFCNDQAIKTLDMNSFQVNLCEKCTNLVMFILKLIKEI